MAGADTVLYFIYLVRWWILALTEKQKRFADEYLIDLNATQAAIRSGYSEKTAHSIGAENLTKPEIQLYIQSRQKSLQDRTEITQEKVIAELVAIGFAEATDFSVEGYPINPNANYKGSSKLKALEMIGKHLGMFRDGAIDVTIRDDNKLFEAITESALEVWDNVQAIQHEADADNDVVESPGSE